MRRVHDGLHRAIAQCVQMRGPPEAAAQDVVCRRLARLTLNCEIKFSKEPSPYCIWTTNVRQLFLDSMPMRDLIGLRQSSMFWGVRGRGSIAPPLRTDCRCE